MRSLETLLTEYLTENSDILEDIIGPLPLGGGPAGGPLGGDQGSKSAGPEMNPPSDSVIANDLLKRLPEPFKSRNTGVPVGSIEGMAPRHPAAKSGKYSFSVIPDVTADSTSIDGKSVGDKLVSPALPGAP